MSSFKSTRPFRSGAAFVWILFITSFIPRIGLADQNDSALEPLFEQLQQAQSNAQAKAVEAKIWQLWFAIENDNAALLMSQLTNAISVGQNELALILSNQLVDGNSGYAQAWSKRATIQLLSG